jgi:LmbE family N-acetylglucosaminyl deacetylase
VLKVGGEPLRRSVSSILCLGAHCDDIEIGCGGTILKVLDGRADVRVDWIVFSADDERAAEARAGAEAFLSGVTTANVRIERFRGRYFPFAGAEIKEYFDALGADLSPDIVFTHLVDDLHQDHRLLAELAYNTFRNHLVLEYEIPKYDGDLARLNTYVHLDERQCEQKIETISRIYASQRDKHWFSPETFRATLRLRGIECKSPSGYAEAFRCRKLVLA